MLTKMPLTDAIATAERLERHAGEHPAEHISLAEHALLTILDELRAARQELQAVDSHRADDDQAETRVTEYMAHQVKSWQTPAEAIAKGEALERQMREYPAVIYGDVERCFVALVQDYRRLARENRVYRLYLFTIPKTAPAAIAPKEPAR